MSPLSQNLPVRSPLAQPAIKIAETSAVAAAANSSLISRRELNFITRFLEMATARRDFVEPRWLLIDDSEDRA